MNEKSFGHVIVIGFFNWQFIVKDKRKHVLLFGERNRLGSCWQIGRFVLILRRMPSSTKFYILR